MGFAKEQFIEQMQFGLMDEQFKEELRNREMIEEQSTLMAQLWNEGSVIIKNRDINVPIRNDKWCNEWVKYLDIENEDEFYLTVTFEVTNRNDTTESIDIKYKVLEMYYNEIDLDVHEFDLTVKHLEEDLLEEEIF